MITINANDWRFFKSTAKACRKDVDAINKCLEEIREREELIEQHKKAMSSKQSYVFGLTGHTTNDFIERVATLTGKVDKDNKPIKKYTYEGKPGVVNYNEETNLYELYLDEDTNNSEVVTESPFPPTETEEAPIAGDNAEPTWN